MCLCNGCLGCSFCDGGSDDTPASFFDQDHITADGMGHRWLISQQHYDVEEAWLFSRENELLPIVDVKLHIRTGKAFIVGKMEHEGPGFKRTIKKFMSRKNRKIGKELIREAA